MYRELAKKIVAKYADGKPHGLADICACIGADNIHVLRAIASMDQRLYSIIIPKEYDGRMGPTIVLVPETKGLDEEGLFGSTADSSDVDAGGNAPAPDCDVANELDGAEDAMSGLFDGMASDIQTMVMLEMMCHNIISSASWMMSASENGLFGDSRDANKAMYDSARKIVEIINGIRG